MAMSQSCRASPHPRCAGQQERARLTRCVVQGTSNLQLATIAKFLEKQYA